MKTLNMKTIVSLKDFLILWSGQSLSQLGSSMTSFTLIIWAYEKQGTVMSIALLSVFSYIPYVLVSLFAGVIVDKFQKKKIMIICDTIAAICSFCVLIMVLTDALQVWHLFVINSITGFMNAFQSPASKVAITLIVPKEYYGRTSGLRSLSESIVSIFHPILATMIISFFGITVVIVVDLLTFVIAFFTLLFFVKIPSTSTVGIQNLSKSNFISETFKGFTYLKDNRGFLYLMLFMATINLMAAIALYSILPPMILCRTSSNEQILGIVMSAAGVGGIVGSLLVSIIRAPKSNIKTIFMSAALSFLLGDIFFGVGRNSFVWVFAAFAGSLPIPFLNAAENSLLHSKIPTNMQGRIFSIRGTFQFVTLPIGYLIGGFLSDRVFEPLMVNSEQARHIFGSIVGVGRGSGMALIFVFTGILGFVLSMLSYKSKHIKLLDD